MQRVTRVRKLFHLLMVLIFLPGLYFNKQLLCLASVCALVLFLVVEAARILRVPPFYQPIGRLYRDFLDSRDSGLVVLTHIYLLIGCSGPLWTSIGQPDLNDLFPLAGIISVGVGDTMASFVGSKYGRLKWKYSDKSVEGTVACACSQLIFIFLLNKFGIISLVGVANGKIVAAVVLTSLLEAFTDQIDNLILPLFMYLLLLI
ncbi:hypothetical protein HELRODRAFT_76716 [Helobdella robusta]|uniref:dolichol kinase n=1 Tax=Helobdella robusta TaxID=6412 RepID=T1G2N3_HELRO|nr:hypothetical protein HELRODRAFT_76716 [Helobdella robusta]ESO07423.1 hypothetical protein HELRODRAFT_76716 [Helobdella robusta]